MPVDPAVREHWVRTFHAAAKKAGYDLERRGGPAALAAAVGVGDPVMSTWVRGRSLPNRENLKTLAEVLAPHATLDELSAAAAGISSQPAVSPGPSLPEQERLQAVLDDPDVSAYTKDAVTLMLASSATLAEHLLDRDRADKSRAGSRRRGS